MNNTSSRLRTEVFDANGRVVVGGGNFFMLIQTPAAINVRFVRGGTTFGADGVEAGYVKGLVEPFEKCYIDGGTPAATVKFFVGDEQIAEDFTDYRRTVGVFQQQQSSSIADTADVAVGAGATLIIAANASRRKVTIVVDDIVADGPIRVGTLATVAVARGLKLAQGKSYTYEGTAALYGIREAATTTAPVSILEEIY